MCQFDQSFVDFRRVSFPPFDNPMEMRELEQLESLIRLETGKMYKQTVVHVRLAA